MPKLKNREEFEGGQKKTEEFEETSNKSPQKQGRISTGVGGQFFWLARIYTSDNESDTVGIQHMYYAIPMYFTFRLHLLHAPPIRGKGLV